MLSEQRSAGELPRESTVWNSRKLVYVLTLAMVVVSTASALALLLADTSGSTARDPRDDWPTDPLERARTVVANYPLIDGHNDLPGRYRTSRNNNVYDHDLTNVPEWDTDLVRLEEGGLGGQFWSVYVSCAFNNRDAVRATIEQIDVVHKFVEKYPDSFGIAYTADDIERVYSEGKVASLIGMEGGHSIDSSLGTIRMMHRLGARYMTLTHNCNLPWVDAHNTEPEANGLTDFGLDVVREMNRVGMFVDISHVSPAVMRQAMNVSTAPVIFSHSNPFSVREVSRNVPDDVLDMLPENGGVIMIVFLGNFVGDKPPGEDRVTLEQVVDHIDYVKERIGVEYIGLGGDYDGAGSDLPTDLEDVSKYPNLIAELYRRNYTDDDVVAIMGGNILRAMRGMEEAARQMQASVPPYEQVIFPESACRSDNFVDNSEDALEIFSFTMP